MATCGFGTSGIHDFKLDLGLVKAKSSNLQPVYGLRVKKFVQLDGLVLSHRSKKAISENRSSNSKVDLVSTGLEDNSKDMVSSARPSTLIPNSSEVESVLTQLCDTASIAEFELKLGGFQLHVRRELAEQSTTQEPLFPAPVTAHSVVETSGSSSNNSAAASSLVVAKSVTSSGGVQTLLEKSADEGLTIVQSPRVGYFRRCRTIKGKQAPPSCQEKDTVKEGQVLCYIDQLGAQIPVETDISGEVVKILKGDGDPVGYGDALIAVLPSFPGIMKLQ